MGRAPSYRSSTAGAARAQVERRWGADINLVDAALAHYSWRLQRATHCEKLNARFDKIRELQETLASVAPKVIRGVSSTMREIASSTVEINASAPEGARGRPGQDDLARIESEVKALQDAFNRVRATLDSMHGIAMEGTAEDFRTVGRALERYDEKPNATTRAALRKTLSMQPTLENLRTLLVQKAERAAPRLAAASEADWAYYEIAARLDAPCDSDTFRTKRRDRWRDILRRARNCGGGAA